MINLYQRNFLNSLLVIGTLMVPLQSSAALLHYTATLDGLAESPSNASPGTGFAQLAIDTELQSMRLTVSFSDLLGDTTAAHIHCCIAAPGNTGVASTTPYFPGFPIGVTSGSYDRLFDLTDVASFNSVFVSANGGTLASAQSTLLAGLSNKQAYLNIHTAEFPGGEIRGFFVPVAAPAGFSLLLFASLVLGWYHKRRSI